MKPFNHKIVYIVGGSSGIGLAAAEQFARLGAHIVIFARNIDRLAQAGLQISGHRLSDDQQVDWMQLDVSVATDVKKVMAIAVDRFGVPEF